MAAEGITKTFIAEADGDGLVVSDPNTFTVRVPDGEVWYVEAAGAGKNAAGDQAFLGRLDIAVADDPAIGDSSGLSVENIGSRNALNTDPNNTTPETTLGAYAYEGELIAVAADSPTNDAVVKLRARRVL